MSQVSEAGVARLIKKCSLDRELQLRARRRDGDQCRVCGQLVDFADRRSMAGGRYLVRGCDLFVVCAAHKAELEASTMDELWEEPEGMLPEPRPRFYRASTAEWMRRTAAELGSAGIGVEEFPGARRVKVPSVADVCGVGAGLGFGDEVPSVGDRHLPFRLRGYFHALRLTGFLVVQAKRLNTFVESSCSSALKQTSNEHVADGDHSGGLGQVNACGHDGDSSARDSESTEGGAA